VAHCNLQNYGSNPAIHFSDCDNYYDTSVYERVPFVSNDAADGREDDIPKHDTNLDTKPYRDTQLTTSLKSDTYSYCFCVTDDNCPALSRVDSCDPEPQRICINNVKSRPGKGKGKGLDCGITDTNACHDDGVGVVDKNRKPQNSHYYRNREKILAYAKIRYQENREKLLEHSKQYQRERKDLVKDRNDAYYMKHRDRLLQSRAEKVDCTCGKTITKGSIASHLKTKYHLKRTTDCDLINNVTREVAEMAAEKVLEDE